MELRVDVALRYKLKFCMGLALAIQCISPIDINLINYHLQYEFSLKALHIVGL